MKKIKNVVGSVFKGVFDSVPFISTVKNAVVKVDDNNKVLIKTDIIRVVTNLIVVSILLFAVYKSSDCVTIQTILDLIKNLNK